MPDTEIEITRRFDAPRPMILEQWLDAASIADWFPPETWQIVSATMDGRPGGL